MDHSRLELNPPLSVHVLDGLTTDFYSTEDCDGEQVGHQSCH